MRGRDTENLCMYVCMCVCVCTCETTVCSLLFIESSTCFGFRLQQREYCYATLLMHMVWLSCKVPRMSVVKAYLRF